MIKAVTTSRGGFLKLLVLAGIGTASAAPAAALQIFPPPGNSKGIVLYLTDSVPDRVLVDQLKVLTYTVAVVDAGAAVSPAAAASPCQAPTELDEELANLRTRIPAMANDKPILLGAGRGAQRVYQILAGPSGEHFHAGISLDFCPPADPVGCTVEPGAARLPVNWYVFQGTPACDARRAAEFISPIDHAKLVDHSAVPDARFVVRNELAALLQWLDPRIHGQAAAAGDISGVPLTEVRAGPNALPVLAILLSGDGGWAAIDRGVAAELAGHGLDTLGWDSLSYFWNAKTPEQVARDMERVIARYSQAWNKSGVLLIGYSFGADALPFAISRLSPEIRARIRLAAFLGLGTHGSFEFHLTDWVSEDSAGQWPIGPELAKLGDVPRLCIYGAEEEGSGCPGLEAIGVRVLKVGGDHHFNDAYRQLASYLLTGLR